MVSLDIVLYLLKKSGVEIPDDIDLTSLWDKIQDPDPELFQRYLNETCNTVRLHASDSFNKMYEEAFTTADTLSEAWRSVATKMENLLKARASELVNTAEANPKLEMDIRVFLIQLAAKERSFESLLGDAKLLPALLATKDSSSKKQGSKPRATKRASPKKQGRRRHGAVAEAPVRANFRSCTKAQPVQGEARRSKRLAALR